MLLQVLCWDAVWGAVGGASDGAGARLTAGCCLGRSLGGAVGGVGVQSLLSGVYAGVIFVEARKRVRASMVFQHIDIHAYIHTWPKQISKAAGGLRG